MTLAVKKPSGPFYLFANRDFYTLRFLSIYLGFLFLLLLQPGAVWAQSCPSSILGVPLSNPRVSTVDCSNVGGKEQCSMWCPYTYQQGGTLKTADIKLKWAASARAGVGPIEDACGTTPNIINGRRDMKRQALVRWAGSEPALESAVAIEALKLLGLVSGSAAACPGAAGAVGAQPERPNRPGPIDPVCSPGNPPKPRGKIRNPVGKVDMRSYALNKWKGPITSEFPLFPCDFVRTGPDSSATVFIYTPSGAEDRIDMRSDTILEMPGLTDTERPRTSAESEGPFTSLIKGTIRWLTPETEGERMRREQEEDPTWHIFNVRTPSVSLGTRGTDFVLRHDPVEKKDYVLLNSGKLEVSAGGKRVMLGPGQQPFTENERLSAVYELKPDVWKAVVAQKTIPGPNIFTDVIVVDSRPDGKNVVTAKAGARFDVLFKGRRYNTLYERSQHEGTPIDVYFFEIIGPDGTQPSQDGQKLWGRFVRYPAVGVQIKEDTIWWYVDWIFKNGRWEAITSKGEAFEVLGPAK